MASGPPSRAKTGSTSTSAKRSRSEEHTSELQSPCNLVCRLLLETKIASAHAIGPEREAEFLFDPRRLGALGFFVVPESPERLAAGRLARLFVLARQEALGLLPAA